MLTYICIVWVGKLVHPTHSRTSSTSTCMHVHMPIHVSNSPLCAPPCLTSAPLSYVFARSSSSLILVYIISIQLSSCKFNRKQHCRRHCTAACVDKRQAQHNTWQHDSTSIWINRCPPHSGMSTYMLLTVSFLVSKACPAFVSTETKISQCLRIVGLPC